MSLGRIFAAAVLSAIWTSPAFAQSEASVNAGQLLEQQRRAEQAQHAGLSGIPAKVFTRPTIPTSPGSSKTVAATVRVVVREFRFSGNVLLGSAEIQTVLQPWLGRSVGLEEMRVATSAVVAAYRKRGWLAQVSLPAQDITEGVVSLVIIEAKTGQIRFQDAQADHPTGAKLSDKLKAVIAASVRPDQPLNLRGLERALRVANEFPGVSVNGSLTAGERAGRTDVLVTALRDRRRFQGEMSADNAGMRSTGALRGNFQVTANSLFDRGEALDLFASKSAGNDYLRVGATLPLALPIGSGWRLGINATALRYRVLSDMNITTGRPPEGTSQTYGVDLQYPLIRTAVSTVSWSVGFEDKQLRNEDDNEILNTLSVTSRTRTPVFTTGIFGNHFDRWGGGGVTAASVYFSAGSLSLDGSPEYYVSNDRQTLETAGAFQKVRWSLSRMQALRNGFSLSLSGSGQFASKNLDSSEQFYLGGLYGVRAFPGGEADGSSGRLLTVELQKQFPDHWEASAFYDSGEVERYRHNHYAHTSIPLTGKNRVSLNGAGLSVGWRGTAGLRLKATWARRIGDNPLRTPSGADSDGSQLKHRFWFSASYAF